MLHHVLLAAIAAMPLACRARATHVARERAATTRACCPSSARTPPHARRSSRVSPAALAWVLCAGFGCSRRMAFPPLAGLCCLASAATRTLAHALAAFPPLAGRPAPRGAGALASAAARALARPARPPVLASRARGGDHAAVCWRRIALRMHAPCRVASRAWLFSCRVALRARPVPRRRLPRAGPRAAPAGGAARRCDLDLFPSLRLRRAGRRTHHKDTCLVQDTGVVRRARRGTRLTPLAPQPVK